MDYSLILLQGWKNIFLQCFIFCCGKSVIKIKQRLRNVYFLLNQLQTGFFINLWVCNNYFF